MKKLIATLLSMILLLSVLPMAGAASFTDAADITLESAEAVEILSDLKVLSGFPDGSFKPNEILTRAQAAKILCYVVLGSEGAEALKAGGPTFYDVPASHWANKYVEYCASKNIVAGIGGGKYNPDGKLTGFAFGKMLLVAHGASAGQFTGSGWEKNTKTQLAEKHLDYGVKVDSSELSRQGACRLALNVMFDGEGEEVESTMAYKSFKIVREPASNNHNAYERPTYKYTSNEEDAYWPGIEKTVTASPAYVQADGPVIGGKLVEALGVSDLTHKETITYCNGTSRDKPFANDALHTGSTKTHNYTGNGVRFEVYYSNFTGKWTLIHMWYLPEVIKDVTPEVKNADGTVKTPTTVVFESGRSCPSEEFTKADVGAHVAVLGTGGTSMHKITKANTVIRGTVVKGKVTGSGKKTIAIDGKDYKIPSWVEDAEASAYLAKPTVGDEVSILLSDLNYVVMLWK